MTQKYQSEWKMIWSCTDLEAVTVTFGKHFQLLIEQLIINLDFRNLVV